MKKFEVLLALEAVRDARSEWNKATAKFNADVEFLMNRLLNEAAIQKMSQAEVGTHLGVTPTRVRALMRKVGLNPKSGRNLLAKQAGETLAENAALLGVEPHEFDLTSPLAYLPMGRSLREFLETEKMTGDDIEALAKADPPEDHLRLDRVRDIVFNMGDLNDPKFLHPQTLGLLLQLREALGMDAQVNS